LICYHNLLDESRSLKRKGTARKQASSR
jgi:hypothetical protein